MQLAIVMPAFSFPSERLALGGRPKKGNFRAISLMSLFLSLLTLSPLSLSSLSQCPILRLDCEVLFAQADRGAGSVGRLVRA